MHKQLLWLMIGLTLQAASEAGNLDFESLPVDVTYDEEILPAEYAQDVTPPPDGLVEIAPGTIAPPAISYDSPDEYDTDDCPVTYSAGYWEHWYAGCDLGITSMSYASSSYALNFDRSSMSLRPYVGWESDKGTGVRVQAWMTGMEADAMMAGSGTSFKLDTGAAILDLDIYRRLLIDATELTLGVGARSAGFGFGYTNDTEDTIAGGGLSAFVEGYYPLRYTECSEMGMFGSGRISMLSGTMELDNSSSYSRADGTFSINEANMGLRYRQHLEQSDFLFQFQVEQQMWNTNAFGNIGYTTTGCRFGWEW